MGKNFKSLWLAILIICMATGLAFAGTTKVNQAAVNGAYTLALEAMGAARNVTLIGATNGPITYTASQAITSGNFLNVSLSGAAFAGDLVRVCAIDTAAAGNQVGFATPAAGATSYSFQLGSTNGTYASGNASSPGQMYLSTDAACNGSGAGSIGSGMILQFPATSTATNPTITLSIVSAGNLPVDAASTAQLANISAEFAFAAGAAANHTIDFIGTPGGGKAFTEAVTGANNNVAGAPNMVLINRTPKMYGTYNGTAASNGAGLTVAAALQLTDSASWQGVSKVFINTQGAGNCADSAATNNLGVTPSGTQSFAIPAAAYNGIGIYAVNAANNAPISWCVKGDAATPLQSRTIQGGIQLTITGTGAGTAPASASTAIDTWIINGYQTWIPWLSTMSGYPTYCLVNNADTATTASIILDVLSSEGAVVLSAQSLGTVAPKTSALVIFSGTSATQGASTVDLSTVGADKRYSAKITATIPPTNTSVICQQADPASSGKRNVPTLQNGGTWTF